MPADEIRIPKQLGEAIRRLRTDANISQIQLAERAELNHNFVGEVERGEKLASVVTIVRLASALGVKAADLMQKARL